MSNQNNTENNKRIARNTLLLYIRTMLTMLISLYTSRVILRVLGVDDFGINNVVGGFVAMFSVISGALSSSISRYIAYELGRGSDIAKLKRIFSTSVNIQICIGIIVLVIGEIVGFWFLNTKMNIPANRLYAANWVLQCSIMAFFVKLISVPYNAAIIAHEKMSAFAYISIFEVSMKLLIVYALILISGDKLIVYSILFLILDIIIRFIYSFYCNRHFIETRYSFILDKPLIKEMTGFAGWSFFTNCAYIFNTQGVNMLINMFFGVTVNAARAISIQIETAIKKFVLDFTTAINPQITKNYAAGRMVEMYQLVCRGAKFSYLLLFTLSLPFIFETQTILKLWLGIVPEHTIAFFRLSIIGTMFDLIGNTGYTACFSTGRIKKYVLIITSIVCMVFPITWIAFTMGLPVEICYVAFIMIYMVVDIVRLFLMREMIGFPIMMFFTDVIYKIIPVTLLSVIIPFGIIRFYEPSIFRFVINAFLCIIITTIMSFFVGLTTTERQAIMRYSTRFIKKI